MKPSFQFLPNDCKHCVSYLKYQPVITIVPDISSYLKIIFTVVRSFITLQEMLKSNFLKFSPGGLQEIAWQSQLDNNAWLGVVFKIITTLNTLSFSYITWKMLHACRAWSPCRINHSFTNAVFLPSLISLWERSHVYLILFLLDSRQSETWHFWFKFPTPPRQRSNSWVLPRYKW